ncbi:hypothetical protein AAFC00_003848 [Neodothiora populina]|uniref:Serine-threonine protein kinase 19 n=1 Tax=Neodothiora populina TaxID=2781224 RepID=A0ABR3PFK2_9PEZI
MSFSATGARRPLQSRQKKNPFLHRTPSSPLNNLPRRKPTSASPSLKRAATEDLAASEERLDVTGIVTNIPPRGVSQDVVSLMRYIQASAWNAIPERAAGMNSTRIAEVLNFRKSLPKVVSMAHLQAVSKSSTATDRELARLTQAGVVRKINVLGRGKGGAAMGEGLVLTEDWTRLVEESADLDDAVKEKYKKTLGENPTALNIDVTTFEPKETSDLVSAGFLTFTSSLANNAELFARPGAWSLGTPSAIATSAATGTLAAVGGHGAVHEGGGGGGGLHPSSRVQTKPGGQLTFSLPATGSYLRVLTEARTHLLQLISKSSPRHKEATKDILRERWDGGIPADDPSSRAKRARGEWTGVLPGKTKKWKTFYGMDFVWILEECLGSGAVECFDTGSVGLGIRAT